MHLRQTIERVIAVLLIPRSWIRVWDEHRLLFQVPVVVRAVARGARTLVAIVIHNLAAIESRVAAGGAGAHLRQLSAGVVSKLVVDRRGGAQLLRRHAAGRGVDGSARIG